MLRKTERDHCLKTGGKLLFPEAKKDETISFFVKQPILRVLSTARPTAITITSRRDAYFMYVLMLK